MKNFLLIAAVLISARVKAQIDTTVYYDKINEQFLLCNDTRILSEELTDSNNCYMYYVYNTNVENLFLFKANYLSGLVYAKGYGKNQVSEYRILFLKFKKRKGDILYEGEWLFYFPDGSIKIKGNYSAGKKQGTWKYFDENGKLIKEENYCKFRSC